MTPNVQLYGMISDRDIATHRVVMGRGPDMPVRDVMTADVKYCFEDQEIDEVP
jgi:CBS domain-containing protein